MQEHNTGRELIVKGIARGGDNSKNKPFIFGRKNINYQGPQRAVSNRKEPSIGEARNDFSHSLVSIYDMDIPAPERTEEYCHEISQWVVDNLDVEGVICATIHGSYLYGTAHEKSDLDFFAVYHDESKREAGKKMKNKHKKIGDLDIQLHSLETFLENVEEGATNSTETLYSPYLAFAEDSIYEPLIRSLRPSKYNMIKKMNGARDGYAKLAEKADDEYKKHKLQQHARRMEESTQALYDGTWSPVWRKFDENNQ